MHSALGTLPRFLKNLAATTRETAQEGVLFREGRQVINLAVRLPRDFAAAEESPGFN